MFLLLFFLVFSNWKILQLRCDQDTASVVTIDVVVEKKQEIKKPFLMGTFYSVLSFKSIAISILERSSSVVFKALLVRQQKHLLSLFSLSIHIVLNSWSAEAQSKMSLYSAPVNCVFGQSAFCNGWHISIVSNRAYCLTVRPSTSLNGLVRLESNGWRSVCSYISCSSSAILLLEKSEQ